MTADGIEVGWQSALALFDGHDPEVLMVTALTPDAKVAAQERATSTGRGQRPPADTELAAHRRVATDASTIAAQERRLLQTLLNSREKVAASFWSTGGKAKVMQTEGDLFFSGHELMELAALDRRVAEVRARIVWFDTAAAGNALPSGRVLVNWL